MKGRINWINAVVTFTDWRYAIRKTKLGNMPLLLLHTSSYAINFNIKIYIQLQYFGTYIHACTLTHTDMK
jgi:hypothetical protein